MYRNLQERKCARLISLHCRAGDIDHEHILFVGKVRERRPTHYIIVHFLESCRLKCAVHACIGTSGSIVCTYTYTYRSSQAHHSGDTQRDGPFAVGTADFSLEATAQHLIHYRDIQLPGMTGRVASLKDLTHPSKLNKRSIYNLCVWY